MLEEYNNKFNQQLTMETTIKILAAITSVLIAACEVLKQINNLKDKFALEDKK
jgi:hypothetical protein